MSENFYEQLEALPANLSNHLKITVIALAVGVLVSIPLAVYLARRKHLAYPILSTASVVQTIPSLALLALMVPLFDATGGFGLGLPSLGFYPAVIALTLYSLLPILRNAVTAIVGVDPAMTEAARGVGMTPRQMLWKVELPLAAPVIIAGIRTATTWVVSIATLATPVGQKCLGDYIFAGLQTRNWTMVMFGVVGAAALAILLDLLIAGVQRAAEERRRTFGALSVGGLVLVVMVGLVSPTLVAWAKRQEPRASVTAGAGTRDDALEASTHRNLIRIGGKTFTEQYILQELMAGELEAAGLQAERTGSLGSTIVFDALAAGEIDVYVDYTGTVWANYMGRDDTPDRWRVLAEMTGWLAKEHGIRNLGRLGFENAYTLAMRRDRAEELNAQAIGDLAPHAGQMRIGGDYEFFGRPEWSGLRRAYGLSFRDKRRFDSTLMYEAVQSGQVDVIAGFSSDGRIAAFDLELLDDPKAAIPPYDAVVLLGPSVADRKDVAAALAPLVEGIPVELMQEANLMVDRNEDKKTPAQAAAWLRARIAE